MKSFGKLLNYLWHIINICHVVIAILFVIFGGIWLDRFPYFSDDVYIYRIKAIPITGIILGCTALITSCIGHFAATKANNILMLINVNFVMLLGLLQFAFLIWLKFYRSEFLEYLVGRISGIWASSVVDRSHHLNSIQEKLKCCGLHKSDDYAMSGLPVPNSCCDFECDPKTNLHLQRSGCIGVFRDFWVQQMDIFHDLGIYVVVIEIGVLILSLALFIRNMKSAK